MLFPAISHLEVGLVSRCDYALRQWLYASPLWYYHRPAPLPACQNTMARYDLIDPHLCEICHHLHRDGVATTPSCQGHSHPRPYFRRVWDELRRQESIIQTTGLEIADSQSGWHYVFADPGYRLPWDNFQSFCHQVDSRQHEGYLGILIPRHGRRLARRLNDDQYATPIASIAFDAPLSHRLGGFLLAATVTTRDPDHRQSQWRHITAYVTGLLQAYARSAGSSRPIPTLRA